MKKKQVKISVSGSSGFLGRALVASFREHGYYVQALTRRDFSGDAAELGALLDGSDVVIHLAGAPVAKRWTKAYRQELYNSRILTTRKLLEAMKGLKTPPSAFICASAVGIYPDEGAHDEKSTLYSDSFLGRLCRDWEAEALQAQALCRTLCFRFGVVLGKEGGALQKMAMPFRFGLGGRIASGRQMMSWVHVDDVIRAFHFAISRHELQGPVNITAPAPVSNREFTRILARTLKRPAVFPVPGFALRLIFGEGAVVLTGGQHVLPGTLLEHGFSFNFPDAGDALKDLLRG